ncbi:cysteine--tRNA ligase [Patescibacteria group bacterium]
MKLYNTLTRQKEDLKPLNEGKVSFYLCGPTVYDSAHLGHGRSAVSFDIIRRYLIYKGFDVTFASNYTDVDDKMIKRAEEKGISVSDLSEEVIPKYVEDYGELKIMPPDHAPRATEYIAEIIKLIQKLEEKEAAYELEDGIYFDIKAFPEYGKLSNQKLEDLQMGARVAVNQDKRNPQDFALWKKEKPGEPAWESPWGKGRPGWHIECSAMSSSLLGETFDIHGGGADLMFPHHECEIAQSEKAHSKPFANYWLHNGFININEEKMSKSLGNFITLRDVLNKYSGDIIRYLYLQTHYRSPINFTDDLLEQSKNSIARLHDFVNSIKRVSDEGDAHKEVVDFIKEAEKKFEESMDDDFETPEALAAIFELVKELNVFAGKNQLTVTDKETILDFLKKVDAVFGVLLPQEQEELPDELMALIKEREEARASKDWAKSDEIRDTLKEKGVILEDLPEGTVWKLS